MQVRINGEWFEGSRSPVADIWTLTDGRQLLLQGNPSNNDHTILQVLHDPKAVKAKEEVKVPVPVKTAEVKKELPPVKKPKVTPEQVKAEAAQLEADVAELANTANT